MAEVMHTVRLRDKVYTRLMDLLSQISQRGWTAVDAKRTEAPTQDRVIDEALVQLENKLKRSSK